jgi:hypothetical protein
VEDQNSKNILAETENMVVWRSKEIEIGFIYHLEFGGVSLHLLPDEWDEIVLLILDASRK